MTVHADDGDLASDGDLDADDDDDNDLASDGDLIADDNDPAIDDNIECKCKFLKILN